MGDGRLKRTHARISYSWILSGKNFLEENILKTMNTGNKRGTHQTCNSCMFGRLRIPNSCFTEFQLFIRNRRMHLVQLYNALTTFTSLSNALQLRTFLRMCEQEHTRSKTIDTHFFSSISKINSGFL